MNKTLYWIHSTLLVVVVLTLLLATQTGYELWQVNKLNDFIVDANSSDELPDNSYVEFAHAFYADEQGDAQRALGLLTSVITNKDAVLKASAHFNRANSNFRQAQALQTDDPKKIPLIELSKQDYRSALLLTPNAWDIRYNLELALSVVPEIPEGDGLFEKPIIDSQKSIESVGFRVDLP